MRSFAALAVFLTAVLAVPLSGRTDGVNVAGLVNGVHVANVRAPPPVPAAPGLPVPGLPVPVPSNPGLALPPPPAPKLGARSCQSTIPCILNSLYDDIEPIVAELGA